MRSKLIEELYSDDKPARYNIRINLKDNPVSNALKSYVGGVPLVGGLFLSGVGYALGSTGTLASDLLGYFVAEAPNLPYYISQGIDWSAFGYSVGKVLLDSLAHANKNGGVGAAIGLFGGTILTARIKRAISSFFEKLWR